MSSPCSKVPSHSADSWKSYWSSSHELPDKIFAAYDRVSLDGGKASKVSAPVPIMKPRPNYADESDSESESSPGSSSDSVSLSETASDFEALEELLEADSNDEGESGGGYTATDMRNVVLHLAANPDEKESTLWSKFHEQVKFHLRMRMEQERLLTVDIASSKVRQVLARVLSQAR